MTKFSTLLAMLLFLGSSGITPNIVFGQQVYKVQGHEQSGLHLWINIDTSGSLVPSELVSTVTRLWEELPSISAALGVTRVSWSQFGADGGTPRVIFDESLPPLGINRTVKASDAGEFSSLKNFRIAVHTDSVRDAQTARESSYLAYQKKFLQQIWPESTAVFASLDKPSKCPCSDISGLLWHAASHRGAANYIEIDVTDGAENCQPAIVPPPRPNRRVALLIILVPEDPAAPGATKIAKDKSWQQFEIRRSELKRAAPWAHIMSFDNDNFLEILRECINQEQ